jgi:hypothetical protein
VGGDNCPRTVNLLPLGGVRIKEELGIGVDKKKNKRKLSFFRKGNFISIRIPPLVDKS